MTDVVIKPRLTPKPRHNLPHASPNHDASKRGEKVISANDEDSFGGFRARFLQLVVLDDDLVEIRAKVVH